MKVLYFRDGWEGADREVDVTMNVQFSCGGSQGLFCPVDKKKKKKKQEVAICALMTRVCCTTEQLRHKTF